VRALLNFASIFALVNTVFFAAVQRYKLRTVALFIFEFTLAVWFCRFFVLNMLRRTGAKLRTAALFDFWLTTAIDEWAFLYRVFYRELV
jgi:hypothetical protein